MQVGDSVWAYNERTHQAALHPVTHLFRYERDTVYVLHTAAGAALRTTSDHPFYVRGHWVKVKRLRVGDSLVSQHGQRLVLRRIELKLERVTVYNFTVDELHTYFVGASAILVHNNGPCPPISTQKQAAHIPGTKENAVRIARGEPTSTFSDKTSADNLTRQAWQNGTEVNGNPKKKEFDFGHPTGTGPNGGTQTRVRVHEGKGKIHGHPSGPEQP